MILFLFLFAFSINLLAFPGDQDPLSCKEAFIGINKIPIDGNNPYKDRDILFAKGLAKSVTFKKSDSNGNEVEEVYDFTYRSDYQKNCNYSAIFSSKG